MPRAFVDRVFAVMALTPRHTYQVLTKRPQRAHLTANGKPQSIVKDVTRNGAAEPLLREPDDRLGTLVMRHG